MNEDREAVVSRAGEHTFDGAYDRADYPSPTPSGHWLVPPADLPMRFNSRTPMERTGIEQRPRPTRESGYRLGWSLAFAAPANVLLGVVAMIFDSTTIGLVACVTLGVASWFLVIAEGICRYTAEIRRGDGP